MDMYTTVKRLTAKMSQTLANMEAKPNIIVAAAMEEVARRGGSPNQLKQQKQDKMVAMSVPAEMEYQEIVNVLAAKAEKTEVEDLRRNKTNKSDSDN